MYTPSLEQPQTPKKGMKFTKIFGVVVATIVIFGLGVGVGNGQIQVGSDSVFRKPISKGLPADLDYASVEELYDTLRQGFDGQLDTQKLLEGLKQGLASATGDQYTEYLNAEEAKSFNDDLNGTFSGIGAELSKDKQLIIVVSPIAGYPAEKAGLQPRDVIAEINGESAYDLSITEAVNKIRGPSGTKVKLKIIRDESKELELEITREKITIPSVESEILDDDIGYMKVSRFSDDTSKLSEQAAERFAKAGVKGIILDLRSNPGGLLDSSVDLAGLWLPNGKTVLEERRGGVTVRSYTSDGPATLKDIPTVVLIDEGSASASEITAGALKDDGAATLIGMKSFGKGSVQQLEKLPDGGVLKVTIARWYTPGGKNIDKEGISPDKKVDRTAEDVEKGKDPQKDAAINSLKK